MGWLSRYGVDINLERVKYPIEKSCPFDSVQKQSSVIVSLDFIDNSNADTPHARRIHRHKPLRLHSSTITPCLDKASSSSPPARPHQAAQPTALTTASVHGAIPSLCLLCSCSRLKSVRSSLPAVRRASDHAA